MRILLTFALFFGAQGWAMDYRCFSTDDNQPYEVETIDLVVQSDSQVEMTFIELDSITDGYTVDKLYRPRLESTKDFVRLLVNEPSSDAYPEGPLTPFLMEKALFTGGREIGEGGTNGGIIKITGHGFSWAEYLCERLI